MFNNLYAQGCNGILCQLSTFHKQHITKRFAMKLCIMNHGYMIPICDVMKGCHASFIKFYELSKLYPIHVLYFKGKNRVLFK